VSNTLLLEREKTETQPGWSADQRILKEKEFTVFVRVNYNPRVREEDLSFQVQVFLRNNHFRVPIHFPTNCFTFG